MIGNVGNSHKRISFVAVEFFYNLIIRLIQIIMQPYIFVCYILYYCSFSTIGLPFYIFTKLFE